MSRPGNLPCVILWSVFSGQEAEMLYAMRFSLPDTPGALGAVATAIGQIPASITTMRVVDHEGDYAVDEVILDAKGAHPEQIRCAADAVPGVSVECVRRVHRVPDPLDPLMLADRLTRGMGPPLETLVEGIPNALPAAWAIALDFGNDAKVLASSSGAPVPGHLEPSWLPLVGVRRLHEGPWLPQNWRMARYELAAAPLGADDACVVVGRWPGMRFRMSELTQLEILAGMALRTLRRNDAALAGLPTT